MKNHLCRDLRHENRKAPGRAYLKGIIDRYPRLPLDKLLNLLQKGHREAKQGGKLKAKQESCSCARPCGRGYLRAEAFKGVIVCEEALPKQDASRILLLPGLELGIESVLILVEPGVIHPAATSDSGERVCAAAAAEQDECLGRETASLNQKCGKEA